MRRRARKGQQELDLRTWGGRRKGAGRPPKGERAGVPHAKREEISGREPLHVTIRVAEDVWNLRTRRGFAALLGPLSLSSDRNGMRVTHFTVQGNHLHLLLEAEDVTALSRGMQGLLVRLARSVNRAMGRTGPVFPDRYHAHVLRTPTEVRNAIRYVMGNAGIHARRAGKLAPVVDPFTVGPVAELRKALTAPPQTWLLRRAVASLHTGQEIEGRQVAGSTVRAVPQARRSDVHSGRSAPYPRNGAGHASGTPSSVPGGAMVLMGPSALSIITAPRGGAGAGEGAGSGGG